MDQLEHAPACLKCGTQKRRRKDSHAKNGWRWRCPDCVLKRNAEGRKKNPEIQERFKVYKRKYNKTSRAKALHVARTYGMSMDDYREIVRRQGGVCAICREYPLTDVPSQVTHIDHCHETGKVRGVLCTNCNRGLGLLGESSIRLQQALDYLNGGNRSVVSAVLHSSDEGAADGGAPDSGANADPGLLGERS
jgi:nitrate/TMAO reductase-like tetraheme cytochrome c subunit